MNSSKDQPASDASLFETLRQERARLEADAAAARIVGVAALKRLLFVAQGDTSQSGVVARFLLGLYNGQRFPFDLTDLRRLDWKLFDDCVAVLKMDYTPTKEVHQYVENGSLIFERLAEMWASKS